MKRETVLYGCMIFLMMVPGMPAPLRAENLEGPAKVQELNPLIQEALENNPEIRAAREQVQVLNERVPQARALEDPEVKIQLWNTPESLNVTRTETTIYGLAQRFPVPGLLSQKEEVAVYEAKQAKQRLAAKVREITAGVKISYYELFYSHQALYIHHEQIKLLKLFFKTANAKFKVGAGTQADVLRAQVEVSKRFQDLPVLEQRRQTAQAQVNTLLNRRLDAPLGLPQDPHSELQLPALQQLLDQALQLRPELQEANMAVAQFQSATKLARLRYYPHLRVELQRWQNFRADDGFGGNFTVNIPFSFWTKSKYDAGVREAAAQVGAAQSRKQTMENLTRFQIQDLMAKIQAIQEVLKLYRTTVLPQAQQTLKASHAGYRTNRTDFLDLIVAEQNWIAYRLEYVRALADREQQVAHLEQVIGTDL